MPRQARLDSSGLLNHVIARAVGKEDLFRGEKDRELFLERLEACLEKSKAGCYAWVLMSNHIHLLIRTGIRPLSELMSKLLTGHAVYYNKKYRRHGHLFQNRYKSIICQEEVYFLELVRYIHLNPIRAGGVKSVEELDVYSWSGQSAVVGNKIRPWQDTESVLSRFGEKKKASIERYREYIREGISMGKRPELMGGGLIRSAGGLEEIEKRLTRREFELGDERILGDGDFVQALLEQAEKKSGRSDQAQRKGWTLDKLAGAVAGYLGVSAKEIKRRNRRKEISRGKGIVAWIAYEELGIRGTEIARYLKISGAAVTKARERCKYEAEEVSLKLIS